MSCWGLALPTNPGDELFQKSERMQVPELATPLRNKVLEAGVTRRAPTASATARIQIVPKPEATTLDDTYHRIPG